MRSYEVPEADAKPTEPKVDWSAPIIVFDPWPFKKAEVSMSEATYLLDSDGKLLRPEDLGSSGFAWVLDSEYDNVLGTATDGRPFVTSLDNLDIQREREGR